MVIKKEFLIILREIKIYLLQVKINFKKKVMTIVSPLISPIFRVTEHSFFSLGFNCRKDEWTHLTKRALSFLVKEIKRK